MAGPLGKGRLLPCRYRRPQAQVLRSGGVPLSLRPGPARGPRPALHRHGRDRPGSSRMEGYNVLFPMGYDAFGLPTENYAIKNHIHPAKVTHDNIANFTKQLKMLGYSFDWDRVRGHHRPRLLQVDPVDLPPAVQEGPGLQDHHARELVHLLQVRAGQRGSGQRRLRALRLAKSSARKRASGC